MHTSLSEPRKRASLIDWLLPILILVFAAAGDRARRHRRRRSARHRHPLQLAGSVAAGDRRVRAHADLHGAASRDGEPLALLARGAEREVRARDRRALSLYVFFLGMKFGTYVAGGADSYGYVSQAWLWANGESDGRAAVRARDAVAERGLLVRAARLSRHARRRRHRADLRAGIADADGAGNRISSAIRSGELRRVGRRDPTACERGAIPKRRECVVRVRPRHLARDRLIDRQTAVHPQPGLADVAVESAPPAVCEPNFMPRKKMYRLSAMASHGTNFTL